MCNLHMPLNPCVVKGDVQIAHMLLLDHILRPLARLSVQRGWLFPAVEKRLRHAYVEAAQRLYCKDATESRISISTGLQRREVARIRKENAPLTTARQPLAEIIALWWDDPAYDPNGIPVRGDDASFSTLARSVRKDVHPRTFLDILIENGAVTVADDFVSLNTRRYKPIAGSEDQLAYLAANIGDHLEAAVSNVVEASDNYDMSVHYDGLSETAIAELDQHFRIRMQQTLEELDTMARRFPAAENGKYRFRAGGYFFNTQESEAKTNDL